MRIGLLIWDLSASGGSQRQALELARYLLGRGHEVKVCCGYLNRPRCYPDLLAPLDIQCLHEGDYASSRARQDRLGWALYPLEPFFMGEAKALARLLPERLDLVNCHDFLVYRSAYLYKRRHGTPVVWMVNDLPRSLLGPARPRAGRRWTGLMYYTLLGGPIGYVLDRRRIRALDVSIVFDKPSEERFAKRVGRKPVRMGSGLDPWAFAYRPRDQAPGKNGLRVLAVGILYPHRRFEDLLEAVAMAEKHGIQAEVTIVGSEEYDPVYSGKIRSLISSLGLGQRVRLVGEVPEPELRRMYAEADVFVFPNSPQTWGLAPFEAMASGTPVVVSTGAGCSELMTDGENALLVPPGRPDMICESLRRLCGEPGLYVRLSRSAREFVERNITWEAYGRRMEMLFEQAVLGSGGLR